MRLRYLYFVTLIIFFVIIAVLGNFNKTKIEQKAYIPSNQLSDYKCEGCNVMLIDIDLLRADSLPCYGYFRNTAPNICSFAQKSVLFEDNYSTSSWTLTSMFSTITSLYPIFHHINVTYTDKLPSDIPTLAETLQKQGYKTVFVGTQDDDPNILNKWNGGLRGYDLISFDPLDQVLAQISESPQPWFIHYYSNYLHLPYLIPEDTKPIEKLTPPKNFPTTQRDFDLLLNKYLKANYFKVFKKAAIEKYGSVIFSPQKPNDTSLAMLFYSFESPYKEEYLNYSWEAKLNTYMESFNLDDKSNVAYIKMLYDTKISLIDETLKPVIDKLESKEIAKNTITIITSDHGESFGEHGKFSHEKDVYHPELFHVPLIIQSPYLPSKRIKQTASIIDIFPTILDISNLKNPDHSILQGKSLVPSIKNDQDDPMLFSIGETYTGIVLHNKYWTYFSTFSKSKSEGSILHDRITDPEQKINVASKYPELVDKLFHQAKLLGSYKEILNNKEKAIKSNEFNLDFQKIKQLQKEGYF